MKNKYNFAARAAMLALALTAAFAFTTSVRAQAPPGSLWYNGDFNQINGLANETNTVVADAHTFSDFIITAQTWHITAMFSRDLMSTVASTASYEIRTGVSAGNGGTLLFSGTLAATFVATGRSGFGFTEFTAQVSGLNITLGPGHYWMNVTPIGNGTGRSFNSTTDGTGAVGNPPGNNSMDFFRSTTFNTNYQPVELAIPGSHDLSNGVIGTVVPEPTTWALLSLGTLLVVAVRRRRAA